MILLYLEGINSISARDKILREIISNLLAHRDYSSAYVAKFVIEEQCMYTENANRAHGYGMLELSSFQPFSKNPAISKVFRETSLADELGSGMRNTYKYTKLYSGGTPEFIEGNVFKTMIPLTAVSVGKVGPSHNSLVTDQVTDQVSSYGNGIEQEQDISQQILDFYQVKRSKKEICEDMGYRNRTFFTRKYLLPLIQKEKLQMTQPDKPHSRNQKYIAVKYPKE